MRGFKFIFGMITVSFDVRTVDVFPFTAILGAFEQHSSFRALRIFFAGNKVTAPSPPPPKSEGARTPMSLKV